MALFLIKKLFIVLVVWSLPSWGQKVDISENSSQVKTSSTDSVELTDAEVRPTAGGSTKLKGDYNRDGQVDSVDQGVLYWMLGRGNRGEIERTLEIKRFIASPNQVSSGGRTTLRWDIEGLPTSIVIDHGVGDVTSRSSAAVNPSRTTTYTLTASNSFGSVTAEVTVEVVPKIVFFTASPSVIRSEGANSTLRWRISGHHSCAQINHGLGEVTGQNSVQVTSAGTYILQVFYAEDEPNPCSGSSVRRSVTINGPPNIVFFRASPSSVGHGGASNLSWSIQGGTTQVSINHGVGDVSDTTTVEVYPERTTTYTLTAVNDYGRQTKTVEVEVLDIPVIESFTSDQSLIKDDVGATLRWEVLGSGSIQLTVNKIDSEGDKTVVNSCRNLPKTRTSCTVYPQQTTSYTLTAKNSVGQVESERVQIGFLKFNVPDPAVISQGDSSTLSWEGSEFADSLELQKREGLRGNYGSSVDVTGSNSYEVSPSVTTSYRLKAKPLGASRFIYSHSRSVRVGGITSFSASPPFVVKYNNPGVPDRAKTQDSSTRLSWSLSSITSPRISMTKTVNGNDTDITSSCRSSGCRVTPDDTATTYTLRVRSSNVDITRQVTVNNLTINRFKGSVNAGESTYQNCSALTRNEERAVGDDHDVVECLTAADGQSVNLSWAGFSGYDSLKLKTCHLDSSSDSTCSNTTQTVTGDSDKRITVTPDGDYSSIYTLVAEKQTGSYSKAVELKIRVLLQDEVKVNVFNTDDYIVKQGSSDQTTRLSWNISGKDPVEFTLEAEPEGDSLTEIFSRTSPGSLKSSHYTYNFSSSSHPTKTTTFTLTADNDSGDSVAKTFKVYYLKLGSFTADAEGGNESSSTSCSGADQCLTITSDTDVNLEWSGIEGFGDERTSNCGDSGEPVCITDTLEITSNRYGKITLNDDATSVSLTDSSGSRRIPSQTNTYTLTVKKQIGSEIESLSKTIKIIVQDTPAIASITAKKTMSDTSSFNRILGDSETSTYLHYSHTGQDPYNLKLEEKPQGESSFTSAGSGFNSCASDGSDRCKDYRQVRPTKTTEYKLTLEKPTGTARDSETLKVYKLGIGSFKAQVTRNGSAVKSTDSSCSADECLTVFPNESIRFSWSGITGFEDERSGDVVKISDNDSDACSSSSYQNTNNPSASGSVTFSSSREAGVCTYTLKVEKTLGSGDNADTDSVTKTIKVSVQRSLGFDSLESRVGSGESSDINRIIRIFTADGEGSTHLHWKVFAVATNDTFKLRKQKAGESAGSFETISSGLNCTSFSHTSGSSGVNCELEVSEIEKTTTYTVQAISSDSGTVTSQPLKVHVLKMGRFKARRSRTGDESTTGCNLGGRQTGECLIIQKNNSESVSLQWDLEGFGGGGTDTLEIETSIQTRHGLSSCSGNPCKRTITGRSSLSVRPTENVTYTLKATKKIGTETKEIAKKVRVTLKPLPGITSFQIIKRSSSSEEEITICQDGGNCGSLDAKWTTTDAKTVTIGFSQTKDNGSKLEDCHGNSGTAVCIDADDDLSNGGASQSNKITELAKPDRTTEYCLTAKNEVGEREECETVKVFRIIEFKADPTCVSSGDSSTLSWKVAEGINGSNSVSIDNTIGNRSSNCSRDSNRIETVCTGNYSLSGLTAANNSYTLTAKKPVTDLTDLTMSAAVQVSGSCPSSINQPRVSSVLFRDCEDCPQMTAFDFVNALSDSLSHSSPSSSKNVNTYAGKNKNLHTSENSNSNQSSESIYKGESEESLSSSSAGSEMNNEEGSLAHSTVSSDVSGGVSSLRFSKNMDPAQSDDVSQESLVQYSVSNKITNSQYQTCVNEGACSHIRSLENGNPPMYLSQNQQALDSVVSSVGVSPLDSLESSGNPLLEHGDSPIVSISLSSALQYARWLSEKTEQPYGVLADPSWADGVENFEREISESFVGNTSGVDEAFIFMKRSDRNLHLTEVHTDDEGALYFMHPENVNVAEFYEDTLDRMQSSDSLQGALAVPILPEGEDISNNFMMFNSGFYVVLPSP